MWTLLFQGVWAHGRDATFTGAMGTPFKIVWHMTGSGPLRLAATSPSGTTTGPASGPHEQGSNWNRPGDEWGSSFVFAEPGCWQIRASRDSSSADLWIVLVN
jgi:hypothetical protein